MVTHKKRCEVDKVFQLLKDGLTKAEIKKKLKIKDSTLSNHLRRLEESNNIKRIGKYRIDIISTSYIHPKVTKNKLHKGFNKRGHAHNFTIHFAKKVNLWELQKVRQDKKLEILEELGFGSLKFIKDGFTIWINKNNLTIYSNNSYYSDNALHSKFSALRNVDTLIENIILKYNLPKVYGIEVFREHYGLIFNKFAIWLNKKGKKMYVQDRKGKSILWVDKSRKDDIGLNEFEGENPIKVNDADTFFNSHEKHNFKVDADFTLNAINKTNNNIEKNAQNLKNYAKHLKAHVKSVRELGKGVSKQNKLFERIAETLERLEK